MNLFGYVGCLLGGPAKVWPFVRFKLGLERGKGANGARIQE